MREVNVFEAAVPDPAGAVGIGHGVQHPDPGGDHPVRRRQGLDDDMHARPGVRAAPGTMTGPHSSLPAAPIEEGPMLPLDIDAVRVRFGVGSPRFDAADPLAGGPRELCRE